MFVSTTNEPLRYPKPYYKCGHVSDTGAKLDFFRLTGSLVYALGLTRSRIPCSQLELLGLAMCGRAACTLSAQDARRATAYQRRRRRRRHGTNRSATGTVTQIGAAAETGEETSTSCHGAKEWVMANHMTKEEEEAKEQTIATIANEETGDEEEKEGREEGVVVSVVKDEDDGEVVLPIWRASSQATLPNFNLAPRQTVPILIEETISTTKSTDKAAAATVSQSSGGRMLTSTSSHRVFVDASWGLVPESYTGMANQVKTAPINARSESLLDIAAFRRPLQNGRRCVLVCDGFYEWHDTTQADNASHSRGGGGGGRDKAKTTSAGKQPYFLCHEPPPCVADAIPSSCKEARILPPSSRAWRPTPAPPQHSQALPGEVGPAASLGTFRQPLLLAGLWNECHAGVNTSPEKAKSKHSGGGGGGVGSSFNTSASLNAHHPTAAAAAASYAATSISSAEPLPSPQAQCRRTFTLLTMPADPSLRWLHHRMPVILCTPDDVDTWLRGDVKPMNALSVVKPCSRLSWFPVARTVGSVRNRGRECLKPVNPSAPKRPSGLQNWLKTGSVSPTKRRGSSSTSSRSGSVNSADSNDHTQGPPKRAK